MKPTLTLTNEWKWLRNDAAEFTPIYLNFDWCRGYFYYATFRILGVGFCVGCYKTGKLADEYAADDTYPAHIECPEAHMGNVISPVCAQSFQPYDEVGGESGWSQAIKEAHEDSPQAMNWPSNEDGS